MSHTVRATLTSLTVVIGMTVALSSANAASHSDAPLIKQDPQANLTDVYAFVGTRYDDPNQRVLNVVVACRPFSEPGDGAIYERFADDARYSIHITHPTTGETQIRYDFTFSQVNPLSGPGLKNPDTILSYGLGTEVGPIMNIGDARQNFTQTYTVRRNDVVAGQDLPTAPPNVGGNTTPNYNDANGEAVSGATMFSELDRYTQQAVSNLSSGEAVFAGPREDGFYSDIPAIFDLLDGRILDNDGDAGDGLGQDGGGVDGFEGFNVLSYGIQIPISDLPSFAFNSLVGPAEGVGVYASVSRRRITLRLTSGGAINAGPWIQLNRMGNPLFNEALVPLRDKDNYNRTSPVNDASFATYARNPELAVLLNAVFGTSIPSDNREDLVAIFIPDVMRVDTTTEPTTLPGQLGFSRLSLFGGDNINRDNGAGDAIYAGFPNGRRIGDDVIDIALTALAAGTLPGAVGDNVAANDQLYHQVFPYLGTPHAGPRVNQRQIPGASSLTRAAR